MSDKCEWKDGKYHMCVIMYNYLSHDTEAWKNSIMIVNQARWSFCPFCGGDIRKPEPEAHMIVKSGRTYAGFDGENWLCTDPLYWENNGSILPYNPECILGYFSNSSIWKSFDEIKKEGLTDEIAKLRPMVVRDKDKPKFSILYGVTETVVIFKDHNWELDWCRLATPQELQDFQNE